LIAFVCHLINGLLTYLLTYLLKAVFRTPTFMGL